MTEEIKDESVREEADYLSFLPGQRLKKAREVRGLTAEQVAKELHLSVRFVNLMEADSYKDLPEPAFVRGYMRRYAQLVKLSPDDIAGKFDQCYAADVETPAVDERPYNPIQLLGIITRPRLKLRRVLSWASLALIVALGVGFLWSGFHSTRPAAVVQEPVAAAAQTASVSAPAVTVAAEAAPAVAAPAMSSGMSLLPTPASSASVAASPAAAPAPAVAPPAPASPAPAATGPDTLVLALGADSWISVQDAKRQSLLSAVRPAGQISLKGEAPFYVNVGNAPAVTLVFNGKTVDLKPHTQGAVATLTLKR